MHLKLGVVFEQPFGNFLLHCFQSKAYGNRMGIQVSLPVLATLFVVGLQSRLQS